jgi:hypothetical protein
LLNITGVIKAKEDEMGGACSMYGEKRNAYRFMMGKHVRKETTWKTQA